MQTGLTTIFLAYSGRIAVHSMMRGNHGIVAAKPPKRRNERENDRSHLQKMRGETDV